MEIRRRAVSLLCQTSSENVLNLSLQDPADAWRSCWRICVFNQWNSVRVAVCAVSTQPPVKGYAESFYDLSRSDSEIQLGTGLEKLQAKPLTSPIPNRKH